jgi:LysR family transcriptional regulator, hca operon transcriptional activator
LRSRRQEEPHVSSREKLHAAQPSLSRQIRDLEYEVGVPLISRSVHGVELTAAGKAFLDHARLTLAQVDAAVEAARRAAQPARKSFAIGFQTDHEINWLPRVMHVLREELKNIQVTPFKNVYSLLQQGLTSEKRARTDMRDD